MSMNEELRHKVAVVQAQLKSTLEKKSDLEAAVLQTQREMSRRSRAAPEAPLPQPNQVSWGTWGCQSTALGAALHPSCCPSSGRSSTTACGAAAVPGCGQEPGSVLLLHGRAAADPAGAERAEDQPVPGAGGVGLLPAVSPPRAPSLLSL